jgi:hypothetical protein
MRMNTDQITQAEAAREPVRWWKVNFNNLMLIWALTSIIVTACCVPAISCACGYMTPTTLPHNGGAALFAWIPFCIPGRKHWVTRVVLVVAVVFASASVGRNLADVLWLSPHAGNWH